ncbi:MAG: hypothetical protein IMW90_22215 [Thermogemmatispora sp.]|uniref:hypothetical protein n=1 Tax=Thermogemmatispora sp. TaxID=1968838 RepID=UPI0019E707B3|nr:hypothetical protein [Thermogemmatispora sp.]MBE3568440.1 hypothetical protein [Thermogemmatispora sp.]
MMGEQHTPPYPSYAPHTPPPSPDNRMPTEEKQAPRRDPRGRVKLLTVLFLVVCLLAGGAFFLLQSWHSSGSVSGGQNAAQAPVRPWCASPQGLSTNFTGFGITGLSTHDVWSIGAGIMHWDGKKWSVSFRPLSAQLDLRSIDEIAPDNIWAVGEQLTNGLASHAITVHYDGKSWSVVTAPDGAPNGKNTLVAVSGTASDNIWAVGFQVPARGPLSSLIEHWDGKRWTIVKHPEPVSGLQFTSVKALASNDVWAVGYGSLIRGGKSVNQPVIEHWNGQTWNPVANPDLTPSGGGMLYAIDGSNSSNLWAVGSASQRLLSEHWDGQSWKIVDTPAVPPDNSNWLASVAVSSSGSVWVVGRVRESSNAFQPFIAHWDGHQWQMLQDTADNAGELDQIAQIDGQYWIVGIPRSNGGHAFIHVLCP